MTILFIYLFIFARPPGQFHEEEEGGFEGRREHEGIRTTVKYVTVKIFTFPFGRDESNQIKKTRREKIAFDFFAKQIIRSSLT